MATTHLGESPRVSTCDGCNARVTSLCADSFFRRLFPFWPTSPPPPPPEEMSSRNNNNNNNDTAYDRRVRRAPPSPRRRRSLSWRPSRRRSRSRDGRVAAEVDYYKRAAVAAVAAISAAATGGAPRHRRRRSSSPPPRRPQLPPPPLPPRSPPSPRHRRPSPSYRHLPSKDLSDADFARSTKRFVSRSRADGWRVRMKKIHADAWQAFDDGTRGRLIDTHCHLDFLFIKMSFSSHVDDYFRAFEDAYFPCFKALVTVFCNPASLRPDQFRVWSRILDSPRVFAACGVHPHASYYWTDSVKKDLVQALAHPKIRAVGECGIDRSHKNKIDVEIQAKCLRSQLKIALRLNKPVVLHAREAYADTLRVVKKILPPDHRIHLHCYTGDWETAREWIHAYNNVMFGFTPLITFTNDRPVLNTIENLPLNRILLETDAPYFVPGELFRDTNLAHPGFVYSVAERIARIKDAPLADVVRQTEVNANAFYDLDK